MSMLSRDNPRTIQYLITSGLGYCCEAFFFEAFEKVPTSLIATRLGCNSSTVQKHRRLYKLNKLECEKCTECLKPKLEKLK